MGSHRDGGKAGVLAMAGPAAKVRAEDALTAAMGSAAAISGEQAP